MNIGQVENNDVLSNYDKNSYKYYLVFNTYLCDICALLIL